MEWTTRITKVEPNNLIVSGYPLQGLVGKKSLLEVAHLLVTGELPTKDILTNLEALAVKGATSPSPQLGHDDEEDVSKAMARCLLMDEELTHFEGSEIERTAFTLGRTSSYIAGIFGHISSIGNTSASSFQDIIYQAITGKSEVEVEIARLLESITVACVDHGVTPPSAQATVIAATARASYEVSVAQGVGAITDVHGGAGSEAAGFFSECVRKAKENNQPLSDAVRELVTEYVNEGKRVKGLGHRIHTEDPRRNVIWTLADSAGVSGKNIEVSKLVTDIFEEAKGKRLPINVDGVIGAVVADLGLEPVMAKVLFIFGRIAGLSAHYYEEISTEKPMRKVDFSGAVYGGQDTREVP